MATEQERWDNLERRLKMIAGDQYMKGLAVITVHLILENGEIQGWIDPTTRTFEPKGRFASDMLEYLLGDSP